MCACLSCFLRICWFVTWCREYLCTPNQRRESKPLKQQTMPRREKKSRMQLCHSNFSFVFGLSWAIKIIATKASNTWKLAHSTPKNPAWRICRKIDDRTAGKAWECFLTFCVCLIFLFHFSFDFFFKGSFHAYGTWDWLLVQTLRRYQYQWEITGVLTP